MAPSFVHSERFHFFIKYESKKPVKRIARAKLKLAEEDFERKRQKINDEMLKYEQKLEKVTETLDGLKADLKNKEDEAEQIEDRIESTKEKIKNQEEEINDLKEEAQELKIKEKEGIDKIEQLKKDIKSKVSMDP